MTMSARIHPLVHVECFQVVQIGLVPNMRNSTIVYLINDYVAFDDLVMDEVVKNQIRDVYYKSLVFLE